MTGSPNEVLDGGSLPALLVARARAASDRRLATEAGLALLVLAVVLIFRPPLMLPAAAFAVSLAMFGLWGILDREVRDTGEPTRRTRLLEVLRGLAAVTGAVAAVLGAVTFFFATLGLWKS